MSIPQDFYANDEDVALRLSADYLLLCPKDQKLTWGNDGQFLPEDRWTLNSPTADFLANGLRPGVVMLLSSPVSAFKAPGELFVLSSVSQSQTRLRRKGQLDGVGQAPGTSAGLSQVEFSVTTFGPQIALASDDINHRFGIDDRLAGRRPCDLLDPTELREILVLSVLYRQCLDMIRGAGAGSDTFAMKAGIFKQELDDRLARTVIHWKSSSGESAASPQSSRFGTRLSR